MLLEMGATSTGARLPIHGTGVSGGGSFTMNPPLYPPAPQLPRRLMEHVLVRTEEHENSVLASFAHLFPE